MPRMTYEAIQKQLAKLQAQAAKMESAQGAAKKKSVAKVVALMKKLGISIEDLKGAEPVKPAKAGRKPSTKKTPRAGNRSKVAAKYRHPETGATWTGRGLPPKWLADEIAAGKSKEQFLIQQASPTPETEAPH
jgi:DNA-binding protein H-NS